MFFGAHESAAVVLIRGLAAATTFFVMHHRRSAPFLSLDAANAVDAYPGK